MCIIWYVFEICHFVYFQAIDYLRRCEAAAAIFTSAWHGEEVLGTLLGAVELFVRLQDLGV
jgi:hypothetical protein